MKRADKITGVVLLVLAGYVIREGWLMPPSATFGPGAGFLPLCVGLILAGLAVMLLVSAWMRKAAGKDGENPFPTDKRALGSVTGVLAGLAAYIYLIEVLGFLVDTFLYVAFLLGVVERESWPRTIGVAVLTTVSLYVIFQVLLTIGLPKNMFGF